ncbi:hypothetical protein AACH06_24805 [Ideonella sp. DXS29W]|uniref:Uncharacterized protein n=1 Tax=Ideonella lacteola TaxID=2984193 RepID=A0ABU9BVQ8_9BURK
MSTVSPSKTGRGGWLARGAVAALSLALAAAAGYQFGRRSAAATGSGGNPGSISATQLLPVLEAAQRAQAGASAPAAVRPGTPQLERGVLVWPAERIRDWLRANAALPSSVTQAEERQRLLVELARVAPLEAMADTSRWKGDRGVQARVAVLEAWASHDPGSAMKWVRGQPDAGNAIYDVVLQAAGRYRPEAAMQMAQALSEERPLYAQEFHLAAMIGMTTQGRWTEAAQWAATAAMPPDQADVLVNYMAGAWAEFDAPKALAWTLQLPPSRQPQALSNLADAWSSNDPAEATRHALAASTPPGDFRDELLRRSVEQWLRRAPAEAGPWIAGLAERAVIDKVLSALVTDIRFIRREPGLAMAWTAHIGDDKLREQTRRRIQQDAGASRSAPAEQNDHDDHDASR